METILGLIRHVLTFGAGFLVAQGYLTTAGSEQAVAAVVTLVTLVWSALAKSDNFPKIK